MSKKIIAVCVFMSTLISLCSWSFAQAVSINSLIADPDKMNDQHVVIKGEVIGDIMPRGDYVWLNVQEDGGVIGIWAHGQLAEHILHTGEYKYHGDIIEVSGIFSRADPQLMGEMCVRAEELNIIARGRRIEHQVHPLKISFTLLLLFFTIVLLLLRLIIKRKKD